MNKRRSFKSYWEEATVSDKIVITLILAALSPLLLVGMLIYVAAIIIYIPILFWRRGKRVLAFLHCGWVSSLIAGIILLTVMFPTNPDRALAYAGIIAGFFSAFFIAYIMERRTIESSTKARNRILTYYLDKLKNAIVGIFDHIIEARYFAQEELEFKIPDNKEIDNKFPLSVSNGFQFVISYKYMALSKGQTVDPKIAKQADAQWQELIEFRDALDAIQDAMTQQNSFTEDTEKPFSSNLIQFILNCIKSIDWADVAREKIEIYSASFNETSNNEKVIEKLDTAYWDFARNINIALAYLMFLASPTGPLDVKVKPRKADETELALPEKLIPNEDVTYNINFLYNMLKKVYGPSSIEVRKEEATKKPTT